MNAATVSAVGAEARAQMIEDGEHTIRRLRACADDIERDVRLLRRQGGYCRRNGYAVAAAAVPAAALLAWLGVIAYRYWQSLFQLALKSARGCTDNHNLSTTNAKERDIA